jgi:3-oxoacyl-[acyl-carrier protein] reductase
METSLTGKSALVTGASGGIGGAIALELAARGARVCLHYWRGKDKAAALSERINTAGGQAFAIGADLTRIEAGAEFVVEVLRNFQQMGGNGLDILVNNAGTGGVGSIAETDEQSYDHVFQVNLKGMFFLTRALLDHLNRGGRVINVSSKTSLSALPHAIAYSMSKAGVNAFTVSLAAELGPRGITVNGVAPGITATALVSHLLEHEETLKIFTSRTALGRVGQPPDIAAVVGFLASPDAGWVNGQVLRVCGGADL